MKYERQDPQAPEIQIIYKTAVSGRERRKITSPNDIYNIMFAVGEMNKNLEYKEMFYALYLNSSGEILAVHKISEGTTNNVQVDIKFILQGAIMTNATNLIVCHNHPGGSTKPSQADIKITEDIQKAADLFNIKLLDSVIITTTNYCSFVEDGIL